MAELPILFSGPMVRAILAGQKTQTRRVVTPFPIRSVPNTRPLPGGDSWAIHYPLGWRWIPRPANPNAVQLYADDERFPGALAEHCRFGRPGDRLWVRETWAEPWGENNGVFYRADGPTDGFDSDGSWRPSIFLPRRLCRLTLEITSIRVERLQAISEEDAKAEGVEPVACRSCVAGENGLGSECQACGGSGFEHESRELFAGLWESINGKRPGCSWSADPWVWAVEFRRAEVTRA